MKSDVLSDNFPTNELTVPKFYDSSNQIVLHFVRDLDEYYKIKNVPERETLGDKVTKAYARMRKKAKTEGNGERRETRHGELR